MQLCYLIWISAICNINFASKTVSKCCCIFFSKFFFSITVDKVNTRAPDKRGVLMCIFFSMETYAASTL